MLCVLLSESLVLKGSWEWLLLVVVIYFVLFSGVLFGAESMNSV